MARGSRPWTPDVELAAAAYEAGLLDDAALSRAIAMAVSAAPGKTGPQLWVAAGLLTPEDVEHVRRSVAQTLERTPRTGAAEEAAPDEPRPRYTPVRPLGQGGMGEVVEYRDELLGRNVAFKLLRKELLGDAAFVRMFESEARLSGRLQHPNIVPLYDAGTLPGRGPYYAMRVLEQPSLLDVLDRLRAGDPATIAAYSLGRLLRCFAQVCRAIDYAHSEDVLHCDLKPANVLIGEFGDVTVVDWGLAVHASEGLPAQGGTPGYMAPEQMVMGTVRPETDVFSLGAILYEIVTLEPAFPQYTATVVLRSFDSHTLSYVAPTPPSERAPGRVSSTDLDDICEKALAFQPAQRYASARALAEAVEAFMEGTREQERRHLAAEELVRNADLLAQNYLEFSQARPAELAALEALRSSVMPWEPIERKRALWDTQDRFALMDTVGARMLHAAVSAYEQALDEVPEHPGARAGLARLYFAAYQRAEEQRDQHERTYFQALVEQYDDGSLTEAMHSAGFLSVTVRGGEGEVAVGTYQELDRRLTVSSATSLGALPLRRAELDPGTHEVRVSVDGLPELRFPVRVRPRAEAVVTLDRDVLASLLPDEIYVPGGPALVGGEAIPPHEVDVAPFIIQAQPVTFGQYLEFLAACYRESNALGDQLMPRGGNGRAFFSWNGDTLEPAGIRFISGDHDAVLRTPVLGISADSAIQYARWFTLCQGREYRLPFEPEWEKAARGVDGRAFPWGEHFDATFCHIRETRNGTPSPEPIGSCPFDVSPYGVCGMAGGIADWTIVPGALQVVSKGGAWCDWPAECRCAARRLYGAAERSARVGFRLVRALPPG